MFLEIYENVFKKIKNMESSIIYIQLQLFFTVMHHNFW